jgi:HK97 family phage major capsid protein
MLNSVEIKTRINEITERMKAMVETCKTEVREMNDEENEEFKALREEIDQKKEELKALEEKLENYQRELPDEEEEEEKETEEKNTRNNKMKTSLIKELRNAMDNNQKSIVINAEKRTVQVTGEAGIHDEVVETEIDGILEPLYAKSVLSQLGARWYTGLPHGDVQVPIMGKGQVGWAGEVAAASASSNEFTTVKLSPKRLTAYVDISKQMLAQDNIGGEAAVRRDSVNALNDKLEATIFGNAAATEVKPAGIFYNVSPTNIDDYAGLCQFEAGLDDANINGQKKYLMGNTAKATFRSMIKGTNATGMVLEANQIDGTPMLNTSNVSTKKFVLADWNYLAIGSWGDIEITIDQYTQAVNGCVRLIVNAFFDAKILRPEAFAYGDVD